MSLKNDTLQSNIPFAWAFVSVNAVRHVSGVEPMIGTCSLSMHSCKQNKGLLTAFGPAAQKAVDKNRSDSKQPNKGLIGHLNMMHCFID